MNLLNNKELLRGLLMQGDVLNTINGGMAMTYLEEQKYEDHFVLTFWAPSVPAEAFNVVVNLNKLVVFSLLPSSMEEIEIGSYNIPMSFKKFTLPPEADLENIEAVHEDDRLSIIIPYNSRGTSRRKIRIKHDKE